MQEEFGNLNKAINEFKKQIFVRLKPLLDWLEKLLCKKKL